MTSISERNLNRREIIKAIAHTYLKLEGEATAKEIALFINKNNLLHGSISTSYISNILGRATFKCYPKRFKSDNGVWRLNV
ncbi:hypothetical protein [Methanobrevibacter arboriphilus]|uniref:Uncharacterized protein n=1 Tax=Methanobrevibacter arboriphilus TaxID=39441 RepID=A0ACA8R1V5_METAZ|nr:hypothetical protein [Methanobrevibacter arboriphilus]BBL61528.1 hypothetical protein MarbSA_05680 [Methanobrevibacter arboriphilus]